MPSSELELNCLYRNWNWSGIACIGIGIGVKLSVSELELELNCKNGIDPSSGLLYYLLSYYSHASLVPNFEVMFVPTIVLP